MDRDHRRGPRRPRGVPRRDQREQACRSHRSRAEVAWPRSERRGTDMRGSEAEVYVRTDGEADGPIPGAHSMLSLGSAAFTADGTLIGTFSVNLEALPGATADPTVMAWWDEHPDAWAAARADPQPPEVAMDRYARWL